MTALILAVLVIAVTAMTIVTIWLLWLLIDTALHDHRDWNELQ